MGSNKALGVADSKRAPAQRREKRLAIAAPSPSRWRDDDEALTSKIVWQYVSIGASYQRRASRRFP
jgi:hypothetical protein